MDPKIVKFERSPEYVYSRAMKNRRDRNGIEALELLRSAHEREPENSEYAVELAETYYRMGMPERSNRVLLDMICGGNAPAECWYRLARNQLDMGDEDSALLALEAYRRRTDDDHYYSAADDIYQRIDAAADEMSALGRREARALRTAAKAGTSLACGDAEQACRRFEIAFESGADRPEIRAMYALALAKSGKVKEAAGMAKRIAGVRNSDARELCIAAQALWTCGLRDEAGSVIRKAAAQRPMGVDLQLLIYALTQMEMDEEAAEAIRLALQETPYDRTLLHMRAAALARSGHAACESAALWRRILRIDPENGCAAYWLKIAEEDMLAQVRPQYSETIPEEDAEKRLFRFAMLALTREVIPPEFYKELKSDIQWGLGCEERICRAALMVLMQVDDPDHVSVMREFLYRGSVPASTRVFAAEYFRALGKDIEPYLPPEEIFPRTFRPGMKEALAVLPAFERQLIRFADDVLYDQYGISDGAGIADMWSRYRENVSKSSLICSQEAAAALAWNYLLEKGIRPSVHELAEHFECGTRRMVSYAKRMARVLEGR